MSRSHFQRNVKPADWGQSQRAVALTVAFHWWSMLGQWLFPCFGISTFDKEASSDHCWFLFFSFVQSTNSSLVFSGMKLIDAHGEENSNNADKCKVGSMLSHPQRQHARPSLYPLGESLPFKCGMSIIIPFYLKTLFLQKFSTEVQLALSLHDLNEPGSQLLEISLKERNPNIFMIKMWDLLPLRHRSDSHAELCLGREVLLKRYFLETFKLQAENRTHYLKRNVLEKKI